MATTILSVFGTLDTIADIVGKFDFSTIDVRDKEKKDYLTTGIAPSYGKLNSESVKKMDDKLKVIIAGTTRVIGKLPLEQRTWDKLVETMMQNPLVEPMDAGIHRADKLIKTVEEKYFNFDWLKAGSKDESPEPSVVKEVYTWFTKLINDQDVLESTQIDIDVLGRIVAQAGATIVSFHSFLDKEEYYAKTMVDIGVLRYPDIDQPYFKVYRIKLDAWFDSRRNIFVQEDTNGITGEFTVHKFKPRDSRISELREDVLQRAVQEADGIFD